MELLTNFNKVVAISRVCEFTKAEAPSTPRLALSLPRSHFRGNTKTSSHLLLRLPSHIDSRSPHQKLRVFPFLHLAFSLSVRSAPSGKPQSSQFWRKRVFRFAGMLTFFRSTHAQVLEILVSSRPVVIMERSGDKDLRDFTDSSSSVSGQFTSLSFEFRFQFSILLLASAYVFAFPSILSISHWRSC